MIEKILPGIFRIELPLSDLSLQSVNTYLLKGKERNLIIDSGMDKQECRTALIDALQELDANLEKTDFFITHLHEDHFGLAPKLASNSSTIYINAPEAAFWGVPDRWAEGFKHGEKNGFPREELDKFIRETPDFLKILPLEEMKNAVREYTGKSSRKGRIQIVGDGESINVGGYSLKCLATPGHSSGHLCLYEPEKKLLFSGDHILETITPAIFLWPGENRNPLSEFLSSLDKVSDLEVEMVLPGHRRTFQQHRDRISELKKHHLQREHEIAMVLGSNGKSGKTAYEIASVVSWHIPLPWEEFTTGLKWMALAETLAHLKYMQDQKKVTRKLLKDKNGEREYYSLLAES
ncbi:MAG TPA: MBL fold metallo-hydrolase [Firmicutes bacterium]|jgi:glyoxylase-like metal-dependent hydrolase (beta-lactamase superfamily II)|nr:MBL fold metallo-hydrolase [Bacillota bacterium]